MNKILPHNFCVERYGLECRLVEEKDAEFIVELRTDDMHKQYIHHTDVNVNKQKDWIVEYKKREKLGLDYYFIFLKNGTPQGVCRIYNITEKSFNSGSWVFSRYAAAGVGILGDIISREIAFDLFPEAKNCFSVNAENANVKRYTESYKPDIVGIDNNEIKYSITRERFEVGKTRYLRMLAKQ